MASYSVSELIKMYNNEMTAQTIYKYFAKEELKKYVIQDKGKKLKEEGIPILDQLRKDAEKYRQKKQIISSNEQTQNQNMFVDIQRQIAETEKYKILAEEYKKQIEIKDNQIAELHQILTHHIDTIQRLNGTLQLQASNDILEKNTAEKESINTYIDTEEKAIINTEEKESINTEEKASINTYIDTEEKTENKPTSYEKKGFKSWFMNIFK